MAAYDDSEEENNKGPLVGYHCPSCHFDTDYTNCDKCDALVLLDSEVGGSAHCTGGGHHYIGRITCRNCGNEFSL